MALVNEATATVSVNDLGIDPALQVKVAPILASVRDKCLRMGQHGFELLRRKVNARDARVETKMDPDNFRLSLLDLGIVLSGQDTKYLTLAFKDGQGYLRVNMLCDHICGFLSEERARLVDGIFDLLDVDRSGELNIEDLRAVANFERHPSVLAGKMTAEEAMRQYLDIFDSETPDGQITREEFRSYYAGVSENCPTLEYFEEVVKQAWSFLDVSKLSSIKAARASQRTTPAMDAGATMGGNGTVPPRSSTAQLGTLTSSGLRPKPDLQPSKRVVGYTGHVPMARERFGATFHAIDLDTPNLQPEKEVHYGPKFVDTKNAFVKTGGKSNRHNFKMA
eukprot:CAMPEP_0174828864 /NCGR_PEP_ID=MMETSP1114-20130205/1578_1 /TAXON_ID=312471 /ORGANISM="Neobodo designis, Strain CCAP 1951/1" /LENGTH=335 /DNA_ID=CAMNT_0016062591 /DNA_START=47 /DNA_END=1054 /DNA_ORIENTATION=-